MEQLDCRFNTSSTHIDSCPSALTPGTYDDNRQKGKNIDTSTFGGVTRHSHELLFNRKDHCIVMLMASVSLLLPHKYTHA